jgi:hypothetical protein
VFRSYRLLLSGWSKEGRAGSVKEEPVFSLNEFPSRKRMICD